VDVVVTEHNPERRLHVQPAPERILRCARCDAPVDAVQRYCIVCGAHQLQVADPAARYMSALMAQRRASRDVRRSRATVTVGRALLVVCLALLAGVLAGRASIRGDARPTTVITVRSTPTPRRSSTSAQSVKRLQKLTGSSYLKSQQELPNQVSVP
jgi:hypothetical protein